MDKNGIQNRWGWLPEMMPGVQRLLQDKRREVGAAHVGECWRRGVIERQPGWFYAREGAIAVGTPWGEPVPEFTAGQAMLQLRQPGASDGS